MDFTVSIGDDSRDSLAIKMANMMAYRDFSTSSKERLPSLIECDVLVHEACQNDP